MLQNGSVQMNFTIFLVTRPNEAAHIYQQIAFLSCPRLLLLMFLKFHVCQSSVSDSSVFVLLTSSTAQQGNQNGKLTSSGKLLLEWCIATVSSELPLHLGLRTVV